MTTSAMASSRLPVILLCLMFIALVWPAIFAGARGTSEAHDHQQHHLPVIQKFAAEFPTPDLVNYQSATSPGHHLVLAAVWRWIAQDETLLQLINSAFSLGLLLVVFVTCSSRMSAWMALLLTFPLLWSTYLLSGAIWITTDNAAWLFVALALAALIFPSRRVAGCNVPSPPYIVLSALCCTAAVSIRQIHIWLLLPVALALLISMRERLQNRRNENAAPQEHASGSATGYVIAAASLFIPLATVIVLIWIWGGLTPPAFEQQHGRGPNLALLPLSLSLIGAFGVFYLPAFGVRSISDVLGHRAALIAAALGLVVSLAVPTSWNMDEGRWGGAIWIVAKHLPTIADRNMLFPPLAMLGAVVLVSAWRAGASAGNSRCALIILTALASWAAAQSINAQAWQRYCEPIILIALAWLAALAKHSRHNPPTVSDEAPSSETFTHSPGMVKLGLGALVILQMLAALISTYLPTFRD